MFYVKACCAQGEVTFDDTGITFCQPKPLQFSHRLDLFLRSVKPEAQGSLIQMKLLHIIRWPDATNKFDLFSAILFGGIFMREPPGSRRVGTARSKSNQQEADRKKANFVHHFLVNDPSELVMGVSQTVHTFLFYGLVLLEARKMRLFICFL